MAIDEMRLPSDPKTIFLAGLFIISALAAAYVASEIIVPLIFAIILRLMFQPAMRVLAYPRVPRTFAALALIIVLFASITGLGAAISCPARTWANKLPEGVPRLQERLSFMRTPVATVQRFPQHLEAFGTLPSKGAPKNESSAAPGATLLMQFLTGTRNFASAFFSTVLFLYFLLASGDTFLHRLVEILPRFAAKRQAVDITNQIQSVSLA